MIVPSTGRVPASWARIAPAITNPPAAVTTATASTTARRLTSPPSSSVAPSYEEGTDPDCRPGLLQQAPLIADRDRVHHVLGAQLRDDHAALGLHGLQP